MANPLINVPPVPGFSVPSYEIQIGSWSTGPNRSLTDLTQRSFHFKLTEPDQHQFTLNGRTEISKYLQEFVTDIYTLRNGSPMGGPCRITSSSDSLDLDHQTTITATDYRYLLERRVLYVDKDYSATATPQETLIDNLITYTQSLVGGPLGLVHGVWPTSGVSRKIKFNKGDTIAQSINTMAQSDHGFDWNISYNPANNTHPLDIYYPQRGSDKSFVLDYDENAGGIVGSVGRSIQDNEFGNAVYQSGGNVAVDAIALAAADLPTRPEGRWDLVKGDMTDTTTEEINATAVWSLAKACGVDPGSALFSFFFPVTFQPSYTFTLNPGMWPGPDLCWLGDIVTYRINSGRVKDSGTARVYEINIEVDASNVETVSITLGRPAPSQQASILRAVQAVRYLMKRK